MISKQYDISKFFDCKQCGDCCTGFGGTYVSVNDISAIAEYLKIDSDSFEEKYCQHSGEKKVLAVGDDGKCVFADTRCTIHSVKPRMCRAWPFIEGVLKNPENWNIMAGACPGIIRNKADDKDELLGCVKQELSKLGPRR